VLAQVGGPRIGKLLETMGETDRFALRRVVHAKIVADLADHDFPRVDSHAHRERHSVASLNVFLIAAELLPQMERGVARALGVVLVRDRRSE